MPAPAPRLVFEDWPLRNTLLLSMIVHAAKFEPFHVGGEWLCREDFGPAYLSAVQKARAALGRPDFQPGYPRGGGPAVRVGHPPEAAF